MKLLFLRGNLWTVSLVLIFLLSGCTNRVEVPPLTATPTNVQHEGKFVWFDLLTDDVDAARSFYGELFDWGFSEEGGDNPIYTTVFANGVAVGGIVASDQLRQEVKVSRWLSYLSVSNVDAAVDALKLAGGQVHADGTDFPDRGRVAVVSDPQGAVLAFVRSPTGDPVDADPQAMNFFWNELWTTDLDGADGFYTSLVDYERDEIDVTDMEGNEYRVMRKGERRRAGMLTIPFEGVLPNWLPYIMVDDPAAMAARAEDLGGRVLLAPEGVIHGGSAIIEDPTGAAFGIQKWPVDAVSSN